MNPWEHTPQLDRLVSLTAWQAEVIARIIGDHATGEEDNTDLMRECQAFLSDLAALAEGTAENVYPSPSERWAKIEGDAIFLRSDNPPQ